MKCLLACLLSLATVSISAGAQHAPPAPLRERALQAGLEQIVYAQRTTYDDGHWYANIGYYGDDETKPAFAGNGKPDAGKLNILNVRDGAIRTLYDAQGGSIRDPIVHYDGKRVLFSCRQKGETAYHLYEIQVNGTALRQLTDGKYDDYEPTYLPNDDILFVSTRCRRWVNCWKTQVGTMYRCDPDGAHIRPVSANTEHDNTPAVLEDGRVLYTRWEYVDRSQVGYHQLWSMNPDGTGQMVYFGNQEHYPLYIDARSVPGSDWIVAIESPGHGRNDHRGHVALMTDRYGPDNKQGLKRLTKKNNFVDPWSVSDNLFLAAQGNALVLVDTQGQVEVLHRGPVNLHEPRPIRPRPLPPLVVDRLMPGQETGTMALIDVYQGRHMADVEPGSIRKLLILESLAKPVNFSGGPDLTSWLGTFTLERVIGTVPVEEDGSAHFEVPALKQLFFVALDEQDRSVKRMQSFTSVMPGENLSCVGCHEHRSQLPDYEMPAMVQALQRPASPIARFEGLPDVVDYHRHIQPVFDRHCTSCHNFDQYDGSLSLEGDLGPVWGHAYYALLARKLVGDGRNGYGNQPPRTIGSSASPLLDYLDGSHYDAKLTEPERRLVWMWVESAAPYAGTYAALRNEAEMGLSGVGNVVFHQRGGIIHKRCTPCHNGTKQPKVPFNPPGHPDTRGISRSLARHERLVVDNDPLARYSLHIVQNLSRPEKSPMLLAPLAKSAGGWERCGVVFKDRQDPDFQAMLQAIGQGKKNRERIARFATPAWNPNRQYLREMARYGILAGTDTKVDPFATDAAYWNRLWQDAIHAYP